MFTFTLALKPHSRSCLSSKKTPIGHYVMIFVSTHNSMRLCNLRAFLLTSTKCVLNKIASLSSTATSTANKQRREDKSTSQVYYTFQGKHLKCQTKHLLMNVMEYLEKEAKKSKDLVSLGQTLYRIGRYHLQYRLLPSESGRSYYKR